MSLVADDEGSDEDGEVDSFHIVLRWKWPRLASFLQSPLPTWSDHCRRCGARVPLPCLIRMDFPCIRSHPLLRPPPSPHLGFLRLDPLLILLLFFLLPSHFAPQFPSPSSKRRLLFFLSTLPKS
ncbi:hypothetical protein HPP92_004728 [Vanilla planifolia]|uniref:Uncharacterized protein n=1 Tax=Vanilla planifolia TaxID=51239 RepID=A0A835RTQ7_VANPL|nr:hypothetical protein HPP92_005085 [Vanilla planifolia]KAG0493734.1 hypothetical protein HPP92_004728 [Vanilla planifolia]